MDGCRFCALAESYSNSPPLDDATEEERRFSNVAHAMGDHRVQIDELLRRPALTILLLVWLLAGCATARPTSLVRTPTGYEVLSAQCPAAAELCSAIRVTGDPHDEEAWGFRARPGAGSLWKESQILYAVGNRMRCDEVRAALHTPSEGCWGPVYFRREGR
jgi:hypothetical protein